jgi:hypothetical protein
MVGEAEYQDVKNGILIKERRERRGFQEVH